MEDFCKMRHFDFHRKKLAWHRAMIHMIRSTFGFFNRLCHLTLVDFQAVQDFISSAVAWDGQAFAQVTRRRQRDVTVLNATRAKFFQRICPTPPLPAIARDNASPPSSPMKKNVDHCNIIIMCYILECFEPSASGSNYSWDACC